ncbi:MAG: AraC family transcriptional regulator [Oscillospiraceae bacterium]|nr:AraC family transcriptional regulator [Oscillospiraceae bacterium]
MKYESYIREPRDEPTVCHCTRDENLKPGTVYGPVIRDVYIVECCARGFGSIIINGTEFPIKGGDCYFLFPGDAVTHTTAWQDPREGLCCVMDGLQIGELLTKAGISSTSPFAPREAFDEITSTVLKILETKEQNDAGADLRRTSLLYHIFGTLMKYTSTVRDKNVWVKKAIGIMETDYLKELKVEDIAYEVGLERSYFSSLFKACTGKAPHAYLTSLRIKKACALMERQGFSVSQAASAVGLDPRNFSRLFKKETGKTPSEFKK